MHHQHSEFLVYKLFSVWSFLQEHRREGREWKERKKGGEESDLELRVERRKVFSATIIFYLVVTLPK
jgi:hypothetical protein